MLRQFIVGGAVSACTIAIHALVMLVIVRTSMPRVRSGHPSLRFVGVMVAAVAVLMTAHSLEVLVWSMTYFVVDIAHPRAGLVYFAFVNYTTLGYGDVTPVERWQLLGPLTAMNGVLLFGWSTAVIFEVLRRNMLPGGQAATPS